MMQLTPIIALSSVMVTCFALSTAEATCCWCSCDRNGRICAIIAFNRFAISVWKKKTYIVIFITAPLFPFLTPLWLRFQCDKNPTLSIIQPTNNRVNSYISLWINKVITERLSRWKIMSSQSLNTDALNKTRLLINGKIIQRSISLNKINITNQ